MTPEEQHALVLDHLSRREQIAVETRDLLTAREAGVSLDPLGDVSVDVREAAEDEFYAKLGRHRYRTSDGRVMFLAPEEIAKRRSAKTKRSKDKGRFYGPVSDDARRRWMSIGFNVAAVLIALLIVSLILH